MASTYSTNLGIELIATGEQSGTWGATTNTNLGTLIEQAISGYVTQAITDGPSANTTITMPDGASGVARNMFIEMTGALTYSTTSLIVPADKKLYFIYNNTTGGYAVTVKVTGLTGVSVPNGRKVILVCNGTDIVEAHNAVSGNATVGGTLVVTGATTAASFSGAGTGLTGTAASLTAGNATTSAALTNGGTLNTPASGTLTNCTGLPIVAGTTGTLSVARGGTGVTTSTGSGATVLSTSPTLVTPVLGTPSSGTLTSCAGLPIDGGTTGTLPTNRGGTGVTAASTGTGGVVLSNSPSLTSPALGTPSSGNLSNCSNLPIDAGTTGTLPVARGGTGSTTESGARTNLGVSYFLSNSTDGYYTLPGGLKMQWGTVQVDGSGNGTVYFPSAFSSCYSFQVTTSSIGDTSAIWTSDGSMDTSTRDVKCLFYNGSAVSYAYGEWFAVGV